MSKGGRLSRLIPKFFRGTQKEKGDGSLNSKGPSCSILFLDDTEQIIHYKSNWKGQMLLDTVCEMINLLEKDYFGVRFVDSGGQVHWIDGHRSLSTQLRGCSNPVKCYFCVKFYAADPCKLREELTRYLFFLQVKRDILHGRLPVTFDEASELCAYAVQSELGDYDPKVHTPGYVSEFCLIPNQSEELEARIAAIHRRCLGATPMMAEHRFLEKVKWLEMYGVDLHPVQGDSGVDYFLGLTPTGVVVYKHKTKVASYFWPRVTKATYKNKTFIIKVKDRSNDEHTYAFELSTKQACKHLWKCCVEHHAFFRLTQAMDKEGRPRKVLRSLSNASSGGRSERLSSVNEQQRSRQASVRRVPSRRQPRRVSSDSRLNANHYFAEANTRVEGGMITMMGHAEPVRAPRHRSLPELQGRESPRSVKTAPWESKFDYGLYTSGHDSPTSGPSERQSRHVRPVSGSDSESGFSHRKKYFPSRKGSDNDSDLSASRRRRREMNSDSDSDVSLSNSGRMRKKQIFNPHDQFYSNGNKENRQNGSIPSLHSAPAGEMRQRRRRRRSKSPGNSKRPPEELKQHIEFDLVETEGMSKDQLMDIPYTKIETKASLFRVKYSPKFRQKIWASRHKGDVDRNSEPANRPRSEGGGTLSRQDSNNTEPVRRSAGYSNAWMNEDDEILPPDVMPPVNQRERYPSPSQVPGRRPDRSSYGTPERPNDHQDPSHFQSSHHSDASRSHSQGNNTLSPSYVNPVYFHQENPGGTPLSSSNYGRDPRNSSLNNSNMNSGSAYPSSHSWTPSSTQNVRNQGTLSSSPNLRNQGTLSSSPNVRNQRNLSSSPHVRSQGTNVQNPVSNYNSQQQNSYSPHPNSTPQQSYRGPYSQQNSQRPQHPPYSSTQHQQGNMNTPPYRDTGQQRPHSYGDTGRERVAYIDESPVRHNPRSGPMDYTGDSPRGQPPQQYRDQGRGSAPSADLSMQTGIRSPHQSHPAASGHYGGPSPSSSGYSGSHSLQSGTPNSHLSPQPPRSHIGNLQNGSDGQQYYQQYRRGGPNAANSPQSSMDPRAMRSQPGQQRQSQGYTSQPPPYMRPPNMATYRSDLVTEL